MSELCSENIKKKFEKKNFAKLSKWKEYLNKFTYKEFFIFSFKYGAWTASTSESLAPYRINVGHLISLRNSQQMSLFSSRAADMQSTQFLQYWANLSLPYISIIGSRKCFDHLFTSLRPVKRVFFHVFAYGIVPLNSNRLEISTRFLLRTDSRTRVHSNLRAKCKWPHVPPTANLWIVRYLLNVRYVYGFLTLYKLILDWDLTWW